jgi:hypothetical protein
VEQGLKALLTAKQELAASAFYGSVRSLVLTAAAAGDSISRLYCFGLGRLSSPLSRHQAALLLLLKESQKNIEFI